MTVQYPNLQIDPKLVPDYKGIADLVPNIMSGFKMGMVPSQMRDAKKQQALQNSLTEAKTGLVGAQTGLAGAQTGLAGAQSYAALHPQAKGEMAQLFNFRDTLKKGSDDWNSVNNAILKKGQSLNGIQVSTDENGRPIVKIGGPSTGGRAGGGLAQDDKGNIYSMPTMATQSQIQKRISGDEGLQNYLKKVQDNSAKFQTLGGQIALNSARVGNFIGLSKSDLPSQFAKGKAYVESATEAMLLTFALNAVHANKEDVKRIAEPAFGEDEGNYIARINEYMANQIYNTRNISQNLRGMQISNNPNASMVNNNPNVASLGNNNPNSALMNNNPNGSPGQNNPNNPPLQNGPGVRPYKKLSDDELMKAYRKAKQNV